MNVKTISIDLAKEVFHVHEIDEHGKQLFNRQLKRAKYFLFLPIPLFPCSDSYSAQITNNGKNPSPAGAILRATSPKGTLPLLPVSLSGRLSSSSIRWVWRFKTVTVYWH